MGGDRDIGPVKERMIRVEGLRIGGVQPGAEQAARVERFQQGAVVDQPAAGGVDEHCARFHEGEGGGAEQPVVLGIGRYMHRQRVAAGQQLLEGRGPLYGRREGVVVQVGVIGQRFHTQPPACCGHPPGDPPVAGQAQRLAVQLHGLVPLVVVAAGVAEPVPRLDDALGGGEQERQGVLGGRDGGGAGGVADGYPAPVGGVDVDVVVACAGPAEGHEFGCRVELVGPVVDPRRGDNGPGGADSFILITRAPGSEHDDGRRYQPLVFRGRPDLEPNSMFYAAASCPAVPMVAVSMPLLRRRDEQNERREGRGPSGPAVGRTESEEPP